MAYRPWLLVLVLSAGCGVADFDVSQPIVEQQVQGNPLPGPLSGFFPLPLDLDLRSQIASKDTGPIDSVTLSSLTLVVTDTDRPAGDTDDFGFVDSVDVYVSSTKDGTTLPRVKIATLASPGAVTTAAFTVVDGVDLNPYINEGSQVDTESSGQQPPDDTSFDGAAVFTVHPL